MSSLAFPSLGIVRILNLVPWKIMMSASKYVRKRFSLPWFSVSGFQLVIDSSVTCVCSIGSSLLIFAGFRQDLWMCSFVWTWKMTCGSKKRANARSSGVSLPCGRSCHVILSDSPSCRVFSSPLPVSIWLVRCRGFAFRKTYEFWRCTSARHSGSNALRNRRSIRIIHACCHGLATVISLYQNSLFD